jgi:hypothetical protein
MSRANGKKRATKPSESTVYIPCLVQPGMFKGEWLVQLTALDPHDPNKSVQVKLFADERDVKGIQGTPARHQPTKAWLRVTLVKKAGGMAEVVFPQPAQPVGTSAFFEEKLLEAV